MSVGQHPPVIQGSGNVQHNDMAGLLFLDQIFEAEQGVVMPDRFARTELLIGAEGLARLARCQVAVFGLGGVGSYTAEALARSGIGGLELVDYDAVELTNINRQIHALETTLGRPKVAVMAERLRQINPQLRLTTHQEFYTAASGDKFLPAELDYVVDAIDSVSSKIDLIKRCLELKLPVISAMGAGNKMDPLQFRLADISKTHTDPLAKAVRVGLRQQGIMSGVPVLFSLEPPVRSRSGQQELPAAANGSTAAGLEAEPSPKRPVTGSIAFVPAVAGLIIAATVVRDLLGTEAEQ